MATKLEIEEFSTKIEEFVEKYQCNYIDAIIMYCDETGLEYEMASTLITSRLKSKIRKDAEELNLLARSGRLPI